MSEATPMLEVYAAARRVSVPIVVIRTADQSATAETLIKAAERPAIQWDAVRGLIGANTLGCEALKRASITPETTIGFVEAMIAAQQLPQKTVVLAHNAHRQLTSMEPNSTAGAVQAVANLRDQFKHNFRMLVLLAPGFIAPPELEQDLIIIDHALPGPDELRTIVTELHQAAKLDRPSPELTTKAVDAISGLSSFAAEQVTAMSLTDHGLDLAALWERKRVAIEQTKGLSVWRGSERFHDLVGLEAIKAHLQRRLQARTPVGVVVWLDEIDKVFANVESDTSNVRMDQLRTLLVEMENNEWRGLVAVGVPGGGKSAIAKAFGNEAGVPTIAMDLAGMESKFVGESEAYMRQAIQVVKAIGRGHAYFVATSNNATVMRPELQRRFSDGMWFFDPLTEAERLACFRLYQQRYELSDQALPDHEGWAGAEIKNCCRYAWDMRCSLLSAAQVIVPMARSRADEIEQLRRYAHGRFLDASRPGSYQYTPQAMAQQIRAIALPKQLVDDIQQMPES